MLWWESNSFDINVGYIDDLVQDCSNSSALAMELLQHCIKLDENALISAIATYSPFC